MQPINEKNYWIAQVGQINRSSLHFGVLTSFSLTTLPDKEGERRRERETERNTPRSDLQTKETVS
jgi:hypothetical protein